MRKSKILESSNPLTITCNSIGTRDESIIEGDTNTLLDLIRSSSYIHILIHKDGKCYTCNGTRLRNMVPIRTNG